MTIDEKLAFTFKNGVSYYLGFSRRNTIYETCYLEVFENADNDIIRRYKMVSGHSINATSWKQALLYTFSSNIAKITVKGDCLFFGLGKIIMENGIILYNHDKSTIDRAVFSLPEIKQFSEIFVKAVFPIIAKEKNCLKIQNSSDIKRDGCMPDAIGDELNGKLVECARKSLKLLEIN